MSARDPGDSRPAASARHAPGSVPQTARFPIEPHIANLQLADASLEQGLTAGDLRDVLDGMSERFALLGSDFTILELNAEALRLETRPREQLIGRSHWDALPGSEQGPLGAIYKRVMRDRVPAIFEHCHHWPDGREAWLDMRVCPVANGRLAIFYRDVTERRNAEARLRESEQSFRAAAKAFADVLWTNDAEGRMAGFQPGWAALTGQTEADYQGFGWANAVHPNDAAPTLAAWNAAVAERRLFAFEHRVRRHDGVWRNFSIRAVPVLNDDGSPREWVGVHHDITDLRGNERGFRQIAENIDAVFYVHEIDEQRISYVNSVYERIWQQPVSALYADSNSFMRDIHVDDRAQVEATLQRQRDGKGSDIHYRLVRSDGSICHIRDRSFVTRHLDSSAHRIVGLAEDVTVNTNARLLVQRNAETFETLVRDNPFGVYVVDGDFRLAHVSQGARPVFGGIVPLLGRDFSEILRIVWQEPFASDAIGHFRHTLATGQSYASVKEIQPRNNFDETQAYDWRIDRIALPDGNFGIVCYFYDLSERVALEASLQGALADKDMLFREIDHRVRNSLSIVAALLAMQSQASESGAVKAALAVASSRMQAIARVHERLYQGNNVGIVEFGQYLEEICRDLQSSLDDGRITLAVKTVIVDVPVDHAVPLGLIANELVTNAFKHCGSGAVTIIIALTSSADSVSLTVSNNGLSMGTDAPSRKGLGMQVIQALARQIGGSIALPAPGSAASFTITVPNNI